MDTELFYSVIGAAQVILVSIGGWTLVTVIRQGNRLTKVETMLESSLIEDIKDLKLRSREIEMKCQFCKYHESN